MYGKIHKNLLKTGIICKKYILKIKESLLNFGKLSQNFRKILSYFETSYILQFYNFHNFWKIQVEFRKKFHLWFYRKTSMFIFKKLSFHYMEHL